MNLTKWKEYLKGTVSRILQELIELRKDMHFSFTIRATVLIEWNKKCHIEARNELVYGGNIQIDN